MGKQPLKTQCEFSRITTLNMETFACETHEECEEWYTLFKAFDLHNTGQIPANELKKAIHEAAHTFGLNRNEANDLILNVDANNDQYIDFSEFSRLMARAKGMRMRQFMLYAARSVLPRYRQTDTVRYLLQYNCFPPPIFLLIISLIQVAMYLYYTIEDGHGISATGPVPTYSIWILNPKTPKEIWRYITYMFIHVGYVHLLTNLAVQILLGVPLELVHKFWRIGVIYIVGVMSGALLFTVFDKRHEIYLAGASGGVYSLLSAHVANVIINWSEMEFNWIRAAILSLFVFSDIGVAVYQRYFEDAVSYISHIGGFIAGLLLGVIVLRNLKKKKWEVYIWWICLTVFVFYICLCLSMITGTYYLFGKIGL